MPFENFDIGHGTNDAIAKEDGEENSAEQFVKLGGLDYPKMHLHGLQWIGPSGTRGIAGGLDPYHRSRNSRGWQPYLRRKTRGSL